MQKHKAGIVGAGIGGIAAAIRMAVKGCEVEVFEANNYPGGKLSEIRKNGFRFDAGPSLFTLPELVEELFVLAGENPANYFEYIALPYTCKYFFDDGTIINAPSDKEKFANEVALKTNEPRENIIRALNNSAFLYKRLSPLFMHQSLHKWKTYFNKNALKAYKSLFKLDFFRSMNAANEGFFQEEKLVQLFNRYATYNGSDPYQTPATMNIIPHLEFGKGAYFPKKGMYDITISLYHLALRLGVKFHFNQRVEKILTEKKKAVGISVDNIRHFFDYTICNMDVVNAYKHLLKGEAQPKFLLKQPKSSSALIFYWGIKHSFPQLDLHNIFFSNNYKEEFDCIFRKHTIYKDPTVYVNITSKYNNEDAPEGCENWFTMINVPHNTGQDWDNLIKQARKSIVEKLSSILTIPIADLIISESILDPRTIELKTSSSLGALYGNSSNNKFSAFLRHSNYSPYLKNLYFCGGSVHPGGGIPLSLLSAKIAVNMIKTDK